MLQHIEIVKVKRVKLTKKLDFFNKKSKKLEQETDTKFVMSRNVIQQFMKTYLHRPIKIQQFIHPREFKKVEHNFKII